MPFVRKPSSAGTTAAPDAASILQSLHSPNAEERWTAARAAATVPGAVAAMAAALRTETVPQVREAMFTSLVRAATPESGAALLNLLRSDQSNLRTGALDALRAMGPGSSAALPLLLNDSDADIRILSCELARGLGAQDAAALLCALIENEADVNVCAAAVEVLAEVGSPAACPPLARCAVRFPASPFLAFAVKTAIDQINSASEGTRD